MLGAWDGLPIYDGTRLNYESACRALARKAPGAPVTLGMHRLWSAVGRPYFAACYVATDRDGVTWWAHPWRCNAGARCDRARDYLLPANHTAGESPIASPPDGSAPSPTPDAVKA